MWKKQEHPVDQFSGVDIFCSCDSDGEVGWREYTKKFKLKLDGKYQESIDQLARHNKEFGYALYTSEDNNLINFKRSATILL